MKTTLDLNGALLTAARHRARAEGTTLTRFVEEALRARLLARDTPGRPFRLRLLTVRGTRPPGVDITNRPALHELLDDDDRR